MLKTYFKFRDKFDFSPHRFEIGNPISYFVLLHVEHCKKLKQFTRAFVLHTIQRGTTSFFCRIILL
jgi:hypothetical protein